MANFFNCAIMADVDSGGSVSLGEFRSLLPFINKEFGKAKRKGGGERVSHRLTSSHIVRFHSWPQYHVYPGIMIIITSSFAEPCLLVKLTHHPHTDPPPSY